MAGKADGGILLNQVFFKKEKWYFSGISTNDVKVLNKRDQIEFIASNIAPKLLISSPHSG